MGEDSPQKARLSTDVKEPNTAQKLATKVVSKVKVNSTVSKGVRTASS